MVPNLPCAAISVTRDFYVTLLGFEVVMDMGWIVTLTSRSNPTAQISLLEGAQPPRNDDPVLTIEVEDVDAVFAAAVDEGRDIVLSLRDEPWGVRRFFTRDPDGRLINVMTQANGNRHL